MAKKLKGKFDYSSASDFYECRVGSGIPWWVWLLVALVALFIASLFIRWDRDMTVQVVDEMNRPVEQADVAVSYKARFCPWITRDVALRGQTGADGEVEIKGMSVSVWSWLFYHNEPVVVKGEKGTASDSKTVALHSKEKVVLHLKFPRQKTQLQVRVIDAFTGQPIAGAEVLPTYDGDGQPIVTTDGNGIATLTGLTDRTVLCAPARHPGYSPNDTTIYNEMALNLRGKVTDIPLTPLVKCNQTVEHTTFQPHVKIDKIDLGKADVDFVFNYYTDTYPDHMRVYDENGNLLFDATDIATNYSTFSRTIHSPTRFITVTVDTYGSENGSNWNFLVGCP